MRKLMVAGNWKMHGDKAMVTDLTTKLDQFSQTQNKTDIVIFPPSIYIPQVESLLLNSSVAFGGQNLAIELTGAYTGEVSAVMLKEHGCGYVLVGHSERRQLYGETNEIVAKKVAVAVKAGLKPIICVGETLEQRDKNLTYDIITAQIDAVLQLDNGIKVLHNAVLAYEPVWAIGTGKTATPEQAQDVHAFIRKMIAKADIKTADKIGILYGGSVKASNASELFSMPDIDGGLVGGASLQFEEFMEICQCNN